jgi:N-acetylglucosaminyldiphosphoundecaprenol N-acetyl-beta-D-mannosaminyltransferase
MKNQVLAEILSHLSPNGYSSAVSLCLKKIGSGEKISVFTPNSEMLYSAIKSPEIKDLLLSAHLLFPDGTGAYLSMKALGYYPNEKTAGIELGEGLISESAKHGYKVFLLGAKPGIAGKAAARLSHKYKGLKVCGYHHGYFEKDGKENGRVIDKINRSGADVLFVCFGFPAQEEWIRKNLPCLESVKLAAGLGGSLDVWSGKVKRAPFFVSEIGLEWLWRIAKDPKRIPRVKNLVLFLCIALKETLFNRKKQDKCYEIDNFSK